MIKIKNKIIPFGSYIAVTIWPFIFYRKLNKNTINHENIHGRQQLELLIIPFYIIYIFEAIFKGYKKISFEVEAYDNENDPDYLKNRKMFAMWRKKN